MVMKNVVYAALVVAIAGAGLVGVKHVSAQEVSHPEASLVQKISEKFNLKQDDVQAVFDDERKTRHGVMKARFAGKLEQLVKEGKLTASQKNALEAKLQEMHSKKHESFESLKNMTHEERRAVMDKERKALDAWAEKEGIDLQSIFGEVGKGFGMKGFIKMHMR